MLVLVAAALAWDTLGASWSTRQIPYEVSADLGSDVDDADALLAVLAAFDAWSAVACGGVAFHYAGRADGAEWGRDERNVVFVFEQGYPGEMASPGFTGLHLEEGIIREADIAVNAQGYAWSVDGSPATLDLQGALTHEAGRMLGLMPSSEADATMNLANAGSDEARSLAEDDVLGLCALYAGTAGPGEPCAGNDACADGLVCLEDAGERYCTAACDAETPCEDGFDCDEDDGVCVIGLSRCGCAAGGGAAWLGLLAMAGAYARTTRSTRCTFPTWSR